MGTRSRAPWPHPIYAHRLAQDNRDIAEAFIQSNIALAPVSSGPDDHTERH